MENLQEIQERNNLKCFNKISKKKTNVENYSETQSASNVVELWKQQLEKFETSGRAKTTMNNYKLILENDLKYKDKFFFNEFTQRIMVGDKKNKRNFEDSDLISVLISIEKDYGINKKDFLKDTIAHISVKQTFHPIKEYLEALKWDGVNRIATAFSDFFGCEQSRYNEYCLRTFLNGAIARIYEPGVKFDYMLTLYGGQGQGKSTFFRILGGDAYYQDCLDDFKGKSAFEKVQNKWFVECAELTNMSRANVEQVKAYITTQKDTYRFNYQTYSKDIYRQFVLLGTTNNYNFLTDKTGNRRFLIVDVEKRYPVKKDIFSQSDEIRQIMAEAYHDYKEGKNFLVMPEEFNQEIIEMQEAHSIDDPREGIINAYLDRIIEEAKERDKPGFIFDNKYYCCIKQIFVEALGYKKETKIQRIDSNDVLAIVLKNPKWIKSNKNARVNTQIQRDGAGKPIIDLGVQKVFEYVMTEDEDYKQYIEDLQRKSKKVDKEVTTKIVNNYKGTNYTQEDIFKDVSMPW